MDEDDMQNGRPAQPYEPEEARQEQDRQRRQSIQSIMGDGNLSAKEKRRSIQSLMDGRRRSSTTGCSVSSGSGNQYVSSLAAAAAEAAAYYESTVGNEDAVMSDMEGEEVMPSDLQSVSSSVSGSHVDADLDDSFDGGRRTQSTSDLESTNRKKRYGRSRSLVAVSDDAFAKSAAAASFAVCSEDPKIIHQRMEKARPKCEHYERNCTIISPCCGLAFGCRICHDECPYLPPPFGDKDKDDTQLNGYVPMASTSDKVEEGMKKQKIDRRRSLPLELEEEEAHHNIDRFAIKEIICRKCYTRQSSKTNNCTNCAMKFGAYHCDICNLWMSDKESPYHCHKCGFCRVGGRENFRHCDDCGMCIDALLFDDHNCKVGKYMSNCPVCQEDLFSSRYASHEMPCGHAIHWHCFKELTSYDTRCPICKKTAETPEQMSATWSAMAMGIALQPVPPELARVVTILCYDCEERDENRRWHFLGVRCLNCLSFNTVVEETTMIGREAATFLDQLDAGRETTDLTPGDFGDMVLDDDGNFLGLQVRGGGGDGMDQDDSDDDDDDSDGDNDDDDDDVQGS